MAAQFFHFCAKFLSTEVKEVEFRIFDWRTFSLSVTNFSKNWFQGVLVMFNGEIIKKLQSHFDSLAQTIPGEELNSGLLEIYRNLLDTLAGRTS